MKTSHTSKVQAYWYLHMCIALHIFVNTGAKTFEVEGSSAGWFAGSLGVIAGIGGHCY